MREETRKRRMVAGGDGPSTRTGGVAMTAERPEPVFPVEEGNVLQQQSDGDLAAPRSPPSVGCSAMMRGSSCGGEPTFKRQCMAAKKRAWFAFMMLELFCICRRSFVCSCVELLS